MHLLHSIILRLAVAAALVGLAPALTGADEPVVVPFAGSVEGPRQPQVAIGKDGAIYVAFGAGDAVYCSTSTDGGRTYRDAVQIGSVNRLALGMRRGPRIAVSGESVVVTAASHTDGNVVAWKSTDQGQSWAGPKTVNDSAPGTANEGLHALAAAQDGALYCVWLDHRLDRGNQIFGAASADGGVTWGANRLVYRSPSGNVCECCHPAVTFDQEGKLFVMWRNWLNGSRDMYLASSIDGGETFNEARKLGSGTWELDACPMDGGYLASSEPGHVTTVWRREKQIFRADSDGGEQALANGEQPWAAAASDGVWIVWLSKRGGDLWLASPGIEDPAKLSERATDPVIAGPPDKGPVVVVWESGGGRATRIMAWTSNR